MRRCGRSCAASRQHNYFFALTEHNLADALRTWKHLLCGIGAVVHQKQLDILYIADHECLMTRGHHMARLFVRAETNLEDREVIVSDSCSDPHPYKSLGETRHADLK